MSGPKKSVNDKDMQAIDMSTAENTGFGDLEAKKKEFLGGDDDDLKHLGFYDSDDEIDFSNFKVGSKSKTRDDDDDDVEEQAKSIFGRLTTAFKNVTGNKVLSKSDVDGILEEFKNNLTDKNVSSEIAEEICKSVESSLVGETTASFTSIKTTV